MEAQFTVRDTLPNFANWVNNYGASVQPSFIMRNIGLNPDGDGWLLEHPTPDGEVLFYVLGVERKLLNVRAVTRWRLDMDTGQWLTEDAELNTYFAELVRAIRLEWEPVALTLARAQRKAHKQDDLAKVEVAVRLHDIEGHTWAEAADYLGIGERQLQRLRRKHRPDTIRHAQANVR